MDLARKKDFRLEVNTYLSLQKNGTKKVNPFVLSSVVHTPWIKGTLYFHYCIYNDDGSQSILTMCLFFSRHTHLSFYYMYIYPLYWIRILSKNDNKIVVLTENRQNKRLFGSWMCVCVPKHTFLPSYYEK